MKIYSEQDILRILARSWNNLNVQLIEEILDHNIIYQSQWVRTPIVGKKELLIHLSTKYAEIQRERIQRNMFVVAEMAFFPILNKRPCLIITQRSGNITRQVAVLISIEMGILKRINVCYDPNPIRAVFTGEIPK